VRVFCAVLATVLLAGLTLTAQSLADVARAEEARRKAVKTASKVYTNENLARNGDGSQASAAAPAAAAPATAAPGATPAAAAPAAAAPGAAPAAAATPAGGAKPADAAKAESKPAQPNAGGEPKKDEKYWNGRITAARDALSHDKILAEALQSRINALTTDFANASDPAQRSVIEENRKTALSELDRVTKDVDKQTKAITDIQEEARKASVPPGWLR
jgi:hypothetical protein